MIRKLIKKIPPHIVASLLYSLYCLWCRTIRFTVDGRDAVDALQRSDTPMMFSLWHDEMFAIIYQRHTLKSVTIVSQSQDGEYLARMLQSLGFKTARGSSSRGAISALLQASKIMAKERYCCSLTVDGPRGPRHAVKEGAIFLAHRTPAPIVPVRMFASRAIKFRSWDKFLLPLPFSRVHVTFGTPYRIAAPKLTEQVVTEECAKLQAALDAIVPPEKFLDPYQNIRRSVYEWFSRRMQGLSLNSLHRLARLLAWFCWYCLPRRRKEATLAIARHIQVPYEAATSIARKSFYHNFASFLEIFYSGKLYQTGSFSPLQDSPGLHEFQEEEGPIVIATAHLGAWELMEPYAAFLQPRKERIVVVRDQKDKALNDVMLALRTSSGVTAIGHRNASAKTMECLRGNGLAGFLVDHNTSRKEAVFLPFLQDTAAVNQGPALLALRGKAAVYPAFLIRDGQGGHRVFIDRPLRTTALHGTVADRVEQIARFYTDATARAVLRHPEQWFWMHRRWKTRPPLQG